MAVPRTDVVYKQVYGDVSTTEDSSVRRNRAAENLYLSALRSQPNISASIDGKPKKKKMVPKGYSKGFKPQLMVCYLCGQQFGSKSLPIHQPQCYVKKLVEWERLDPERRGAPPRHPSQVQTEVEVPISGLKGAALDAFNDNQFSQFTQGLVPCDNCGRRFLPDRLEVHLRSCQPGKGSKPVRRPGASNVDIVVSAPSTGQPSTSTSFDDTPIGGSSRRSLSASAANREAPPNTVECPKCFRSFNPTSAEKHIPNCHAKPIRRPGDDTNSLSSSVTTNSLSIPDLAAHGANRRAHSAGASREAPNNGMVECPTCLRTFNPLSAEKHIPNCHAKPIRKPDSAPINSPPNNKSLNAPFQSRTTIPAKVVTPLIEEEYEEEEEEYEEYEECEEEEYEECDISEEVHSNTILPTPKKSPRDLQPSPTPAVPPPRSPITLTPPSNKLPSSNSRSCSPASNAEPPSTPNPKFCSECGFRFENMVKFCPECGFKVVVI